MGETAGSALTIDLSDLVGASVVDNERALRAAEGLLRRLGAPIDAEPIRD
jgi:hypothetical protein